MKGIFVLMVILLTTTVSGKDIPTPFWYSITQKILSETQDYIIHEDHVNDQLKEKSSIRKKVSNVKLQCEPGGKLVQLPFITLKSNPIWAKLE